MTRLLRTILLLSLAVPQAAVAQSDCVALLKAGIFNTIISDTHKSISWNLNQWLQSTTYNEFHEKQAGGLTIGIPGILSLGGDADEETFHKVQTALQSGTVAGLSDTEAKTVIYRSASKPILEAFDACENSVGLKLSHTENGADIILVATYRPIAVNDIAKVSPNGLSVIGATTVQSGLNGGDTIPPQGRAILLQWTDTLKPISIVLNTDHGTRVEAIPAKEKTPPPPTKTPTLRLEMFHAVSSAAQHPSDTLVVPAGHKILGGGARVEYSGPGNMLTASYPENDTTWIASSKDHGVASVGTVEVWVITVYDPQDEWDVVIDSQAGAPANHPTANVILPGGYTLTGGGAKVTYHGSGSLLTASFPLGLTGWQADSKDHQYADIATVTAYAIGIRPRSGAPPPQSQVFVAVGPQAAHAAAAVTVGAGYLLVGGGARVIYGGAGNMLTASFPDGGGQWTALSKDHFISDPATVTAFAIGIRP